MSKSKIKSFVFRLKDSFFSILSVVVFVLFILFTVWGKDGLIDLVALRQQKESIRVANFKILRENLKYSEEVSKLKYRPYVEQKARSDLGFVRENETVFVVQ